MYYFQENGTLVLYKGSARNKSSNEVLWIGGNKKKTFPINFEYFFHKKNNYSAIISPDGNLEVRSGSKVR